MAYASSWTFGRDGILACPWLAFSTESALLIAALACSLEWATVSDEIGLQPPLVEPCLMM